MARKPTKILQSLRGGVESIADTAQGSDIYVIRSIGKLLHGVEVMTEQVMQVDKSVGKFEMQVTKFAQATVKSEEIMRQLTLVGVAVVIAQFVLAGTIWWVAR